MWGVLCGRCVEPNSEESILLGESTSHFFFFAVSECLFSLFCRFLCVCGQKMFSWISSMIWGGADSAPKTTGASGSFYNAVRAGQWRCLFVFVFHTQPHFFVPLFTLSLLVLLKQVSEMPSNSEAVRQERIQPCCVPCV